MSEHRIYEHSYTLNSAHDSHYAFDIVRRDAMDWLFGLLGVDDLEDLSFFNLDEDLSLFDLDNLDQCIDDIGDALADVWASGVDAEVKSQMENMGLTVTTEFELGRNWLIRGCCYTHIPKSLEEKLSEIVRNAVLRDWDHMDYLDELPVEHQQLIAIMAFSATFARRDES